ncbi:hypothetical protein [Natronolimnohabitans innermongolicus]|uniref:Uncharacterized protein n=1 Tax=Natronolimnohabitans innermongolicus JCM 12255 TaxID=1227499 RepID=L9WXW6_9EURY|nr:hypothetical protein [Natronolimnohabitans innermongolicus]ELY53996.1 hypothetical protein C493_13138 [Natronolimnohabitans innermongolicus JCM 12255]
MKKSDPNPIEGIARNYNAPRPTYIELGDNTEGASHVYRTSDGTIHVVPDGLLIQKCVLNVHFVDDYVKFVRDRVDNRDWADRHYYADDESPFEAFVRSISTEGSA